MVYYFFRRRIIANPLKPIARSERAEGSGTLATRNPRMTMSSSEGLPKLRVEASNMLLLLLFQEPPLSSRISSAKLLLPSIAVSFHSHTFPPCPIVPYGLSPPALLISAGPA